MRYTAWHAGGSPAGAVKPGWLRQGYAGWGAGQLEAEVKEGCWWLLAAAPSVILAAIRGAIRAHLRAARFCCTVKVARDAMGPEAAARSDDAAVAGLSNWLRLVRHLPARGRVRVSCDVHECARAP